MSELIDQIDRVIAWNKGLNSDEGPLTLGEAMDKIRGLAVHTESALDIEIGRSEKLW